MSRSIIIASAVFGVVFAIGLLLIPFSVAGIEETAPDVSCGNLIAHYLDSTRTDSCDTGARGRGLTAFAAVFLAAISSGVLRRATSTSLNERGTE